MTWIRAFFSLRPRGIAIVSAILFAYAAYRLIIIGLLTFLNLDTLLFLNGVSDALFLISRIGFRLIYFFFLIYLALDMWHLRPRAHWGTILWISIMLGLSTLNFLSNDTLSIQAMAYWAIGLGIIVYLMLPSNRRLFYAKTKTNEPPDNQIA
jgi:hypothetical protein